MPEVTYAFSPTTFNMMLGMLFRFLSFTMLFFLVSCQDERQEVFAVPVAEGTTRTAIDMGNRSKPDKRFDTEHTRPRDYYEAIIVNVFAFELEYDVYSLGRKVYTGFVSPPLIGTYPISYVPTGKKRLAAKPLATAGREIHVELFNGVASLFNDIVIGGPFPNVNASQGLAVSLDIGNSRDMRYVGGMLNISYQPDGELDTDALISMGAVRYKRKFAITQNETGVLNLPITGTSVYDATVKHERLILRDGESQGWNSRTLTLNGIDYEIQVTQRIVPWLY